MKTIYHKMFFLCYLLTYKTRDKFNAVIAGSSIISTLFLLNIILLSSVVKLWESKTLVQILFVFMALSALNITYFLYKKRYELIIEKFKSESKTNRFYSIMVFIVYVILSLISPALV